MSIFPEYLHYLPGVQSRSINAENPTGELGAGGSASSSLGPGRKGRAYLPLPAGSKLVLADIQGPGVIRHLWITLPATTPAGSFVLRDVILRVYWDDEQSPSIETPIGDFFCNGFGARQTVVSELVTVAPTGGMNSYFVMPFRKRARITLESRHPGPIDAVFFQVDYSLGDEIPDSVGYLHAQWRRADQLPKGTDVCILDNASGPGQYVGTFIALTALSRFWWGEGEVKFFIDTDENLPTICGTGLEDYVGGAWGFQDKLDFHEAPQVFTYTAPYFGYPYRSSTDVSGRSPYAREIAPSHGLFRWHLPDPIRFASRLRVTLQQIGHDGHELFERSDDISTVAYWYQCEPHMPFPELADAEHCRPR